MAYEDYLLELGRKSPETFAYTEARLAVDRLPTPQARTIPSIRTPLRELLTYIGISSSSR